MKLAKNFRENLGNYQAPTPGYISCADDDDYIPICLLGKDLMSSSSVPTFIPQAAGIKERYLALDPNLRIFLDWLKYQSDLKSLNTPFEFQILKNQLQSLNINEVFSIGSQRFTTRVMNPISVPGYKILVGNAINKFGTGQMIKINSKTTGEQAYYSNYFLLASAKNEGGILHLDPLCLLVTQRKNSTEINMNLTLGEEVDSDKLEFWIKEEFIQSNSPLYVFYRKIMYPILKANNIKIVVKKSLFTEFFRVLNIPKFPSLKERLDHQKTLLQEFISAERTFITSTVKPEKKKSMVEETKPMTDEMQIQAYMIQWRGREQQFHGDHVFNNLEAQAYNRLVDERQLNQTLLGTIQPVEFDEYEDDEYDDSELEEAERSQEMVSLSPEELAEINEIESIVPQGISEEEMDAVEAGRPVVYDTSDQVERILQQMLAEDSPRVDYWNESATQVIEAN